MCYYFALLRLFSLWVIVLPSISSETTGSGDDSDTSSSLGREILSWLHASQGGYFNPKTEFRRASPESPLLGVFAKEQIKKGELLCRVPWDLMIRGSEDGFLTDYEAETVGFSCTAAQLLAREMELGDDSKIAPYVNYLKSQRDDQIPSAWSKQGQALFLDILGAEEDSDEMAQQLRPVNPISWLAGTNLNDYNNHGDYDEEGESCILKTPLQRKAAWMVIQRADDSLIIPAYDMYNHRNGKWKNTDTEIYHGKYHETRASKTIEAGEQIHNSYNHCLNCGGRKNFYGTAEILRDYGFVEPFPQRWIYQSYQFDLDEMEKDANEDSNNSNGRQLMVTWHKEYRPHTQEETQKFTYWLRQQLQRLRRIWNIEWAHKAKDSNHGIPVHEWDLIWQFHEANVVAMTAALESLGTDADSDLEMTCSSTDWKNNSCANIFISQNHYDSFEYEIDDELDLNRLRCDVEEAIDNYIGHMNVGTHHRKVEFSEDYNTGDACMGGDGYVVCNSFRPHQFEYPIRTAAKFRNNVKRVLFIGEETTLLLHEILKFPELELVVGISEDQAWTRASASYFETSAHFEDERVEWWFGNAIKSIGLFPAEYWNSFDLVYVGDLTLSSTTSLFSSVHGWFRVLSMLLNEDGIMIKSGAYIQDMSKLFKHSAQFFHEGIPLICSASTTMGGQNVDFLHTNTDNHDTGGFLDGAFSNSAGQLKDMQIYRSEQIQRDCMESDDNAIKKALSSSVGLLGLLDIFKPTITLDEMNILLKKTVSEAELTQLSFSVIGDNVAFLMMEEGYILGRIWPEATYCGFDIHLWDKTDKVNTLQTSLLKQVNAASYSSFRVVVGGMNGKLGQLDGQDFFAPVDVSVDECQHPAEGSETSPRNADEALLYSATIDEILAFTELDEIAVLVLCEDRTNDACKPETILTDRSKVIEVITLKECAGIEESKDPIEMFTAMNECEKIFVDDIFSQLKNKIQIIVIDGAASPSLLQILNSIFSVRNNYEQFLATEHIVLTLDSIPKQNTVLKANFLDRHQKRQRRFPVARSEITISTASEDFEIGIFTSGYELSIEKLAAVEKRLSGRLDETNWNVTLKMIQSRHKDFFYLPATFPHFEVHEYPVSKSHSPFAESMPYGVRRIVRLQFDSPEEVGSGITGQGITSAIDVALASANFEFLYFRQFQREGGKGLVNFYSRNEESFILVWDGHQSIDLIMFPSSHFEEVLVGLIEELADYFEENIIVVDDSMAYNFAVDNHELRDDESEDYEYENSDELDS